MRLLLPLLLALPLMHGAVISPIDTSVTWYEVKVREREIVWGIASDDGMAMVAIGDPRTGFYPNITHIRYQTPSVVSIRPILVEEIERLNASIVQRNAELESTRRQAVEAYRRASEQRALQREADLRAVSGTPVAPSAPSTAPVVDGGAPLVAGNGDVRGIDNDRDGRPEPVFVGESINGRRSHFRAVAVRQGASLTLSRMPAGSGLIQTIDGAVFECDLLSKYDAMLWMPGDELLVAKTFDLPSGGTGVVLRNVSSRSSSERLVTAMRLR